MRRLFATSKLIWIERFREAGAILLSSFFGHSGEEILRSGEQVIPSTFGFQFREHKRRECFLFFFWKLGRFRDHLVQQSTHEQPFYSRKIGYGTGTESLRM